MLFSKSGRFPSILLLTSARDVRVHASYTHTRRAFSLLHILIFDNIQHGTSLPPLRFRSSLRYPFQGGPPPDSFVSALGGNTLRTLGAAAAISLLALASFGSVLVMEVPYTSHDASSVALEKGTSDIYAWKCPDGKGGYTDEILVMNIPIDAFQRSMERDIIRSSNVFESCPVSFIESDYYVQKVAEHISGKVGDASDLLEAEAVLSFVRSSICYSYDDRTYGTGDFWAYPVETLFLHKGDCEDTSVLFCSIASEMGLDCVLLDYDGHVAAGIREGDCYLFCETAYDSPHPIGGSHLAIDGEEPDIYRIGDTSVLMFLNHGIAGYRNLIQRLAGA